jgi:hypothetical protein
VEVTHDGIAVAIGTVDIGGIGMGGAANSVRIVTMGRGGIGMRALKVRVTADIVSASHIASVIRQKDVAAKAAVGPGPRDAAIAIGIVRAAGATGTVKVAANAR